MEAYGEEEEGVLFTLMSRREELLEKVKTLEGAIKRYEETHRIEFFKPFEHQQRALDFIDGGKKTVLLQGANRIGKTVLGSCVCGAAAVGFKPWTEKKEVTVWGVKPMRVRIICVDWEHHAKEVVVPALKEWLVAGSYETYKNNVGVEAYFRFPKTGSTFELMTHVQETKIHEGWKGDLVWADEPLPKDKYIANKRGLIDLSGLFLMTMTAVYEPWILDEIVLSNDVSIGCVTEVPMRANPKLSEQDIKNFESATPEDVREARVRGVWLHLTGLILKGFDREKNIVDDFKVPPDLPVVACIDLHLSRPQAVGFYCWDKYDREFVVDEIWQNGSPEELADEIVRRKNANQWRMRSVYIDPLAKGDSNNPNTVYDRLSNRLGSYGIGLSVASKDKEGGIISLNSLLWTENQMPGLLFFRDCKHSIRFPRFRKFNLSNFPTTRNNASCYHSN